MVLVVLSDRYGNPAVQHAYADVKRVFECDGAINTICLTEENVWRLDGPGFAANLVLKFNIKAGGINHISSTLEKIFHRKNGNGTMIVGADFVGSEPFVRTGSFPSETQRSCLGWPWCLAGNGCGWLRAASRTSD